MPKQVSIIPDDEIPVLLTIFNRPDKVRLVIDNLRIIKPKYIFIYADGPRSNVHGDIEKCHRSRDVCLQGIDWKCKLEINFLDHNEGCDNTVPKAITWFFSKVKYGIILEDDCIVSDQFFPFCGELLKKYEDDKRVMQISSLSPYAIREYPYDYHFSRMFRCSGGWATWRRAWNHQVTDITKYSDLELSEILKSYYRDYYDCMKRLKDLKQCKKYKPNNPKYWEHYYSHWDYQWNLSCAAQNGLSIVPEKNMMINVGFDEESTHTIEKSPIFENIYIQKLDFPIRHPAFVYADTNPEKKLEKKIYKSLSIRNRMIYILKKLSGSFFYLKDVIP